MTAGIGHTRWATHGAAVRAQRPPATATAAARSRSCITASSRITRNLGQAGRRGPHTVLRDRLRGGRHLLERELATGAGLAEALRRCVGELRGDFALAAVTTREPQVIAAARRTSPLILGRIDGTGLVASDIAALLGTTRDLYQLADDEIAEVRPDSISVVVSTANSAGSCRSRSDGTSSPLGATAMTTSCRKRSTSSRGHSQTPSWEGFTSTAPPSSRSFASPALTRRDRACRADGLRLGLLRLPERSDRLRTLGPGCRRKSRSPASLRLPGRDPRRTYSRRSRQPVGGDRRHLPRAARGTAPRCQDHRADHVVDSLLAREADGALYTRAGPEIGVASTSATRPR